MKTTTPVAPTAGQQTAKTPGVGLVPRAGRINPTKTPPGCPSSWTINTAAQPWQATGLDPYVTYPGSSDPRYEEFVRLYVERYAAGRRSTNGLPCDSGGTAGGDPHGTTGEPFLRALFVAGSAPHLVAGRPETHNGSPTAQELDDLAHSGELYKLVAAAYEALTATKPPTGPAPPPPAKPQCSPGWHCEPVPQGLIEQRRSEGWEIRKARRELRAPLDCWRETPATFGPAVLEYVDSPRCLLTPDPEPPVEPKPPEPPEPPEPPPEPPEPPPKPEPPVEPPIEPKPPAPPDPPCDLSSLELDMTLLLAEFQVQRSMLAAQDVVLDNLRARQQELERRAAARHAELLEKLGKTP